MTQTLSKFYVNTIRERQELENIQLPNTLPELLSSAAASHCDTIAVNFFEDHLSLTFSELHTSTNRVAHTLAQLGVAQGTHVAVMLPNRIEFPVIWLALASLGAVMVPVITSYTPRELSFLLDDSDVEFLIIDDAFTATLQNTEDNASRLSIDRILVVGLVDDSLYLDFDRLIADGDPNFVSNYSPQPDDLLNIQYTSGTTGLPKGVMQTHEYWITAGCRAGLIWGDIKSILSDHPFFYMDPQWMLVAGLYLGATVHFSRRMSVSKFMGWIHAYDIELAYLPDPLLKRPPEEGDDRTRVKVFLAYAFSGEMVRQAESRYKGCVVREGFGMTEIGGGLVVPPVIDDEDILGSCGIPSVFRQCRIVDEHGNDVKQGKVGELWVKGKGICLGYYKCPEANKESFVDGWFRTGDLFRQDKNGYFFIVGRIKDMVKRGGENISALEVETVLKDLPEVEEAAIVPVPDDEREEEVKAYIKLTQGSPNGTEAAKYFVGKCRESLAKFKVPRFIEFVENFPMTPSGKVAKPTLMEAKDNLRAGSFDAVADRWISAS
jgi:acyl-CoA synthetase (AMP-forming)/AMP-acid ligase II